MRRIVVVGNCGAGKSTLARALADRLALPRIELDALFHGPGWTPRPAFAEDVERATRGEAWVVDGNYRTIRDLVWSRADTIVWLDLSRLLTEVRVVKRSLLRWLAREELWNGNREGGPHRWLTPDHPVRWSWSQHAEYRRAYAERFADPAFAHARRIRLRDPRAVRAFLESAR